MESPRNQAAAQTTRSVSRPRLSIREVARRAGVSVATVSRVTNGVVTVDPVLAERVWKVVADVGYTPDHQARALVSGRSRTFGLLISEITNPFFPELIQSFERVAVAAGYEVMLGWIDSDPQRTRNCIRRMLQRKVEGVAVMTFGNEGPLIEEMAGYGVPLVFVDEGPLNTRTTILHVNYTQGIRDAVRHLAALGHTKIGFVSGPLQQKSAKLRQVAFIAVLAESNLPVQKKWIVEGDHTLEGGMASAERLLLLADRPTAVLCSNDMTAIGVLRVLARERISVPGEVSLIGYDDIHLAAFTSPPLTTVGMSRKDLAESAFRALLRHSQALTQNGPSAFNRIETTLVVRESTGPVLRVQAHHQLPKRSSRRSI